MAKNQSRIKNPSYGVTLTGPTGKLVVDGASCHPCGGLFATHGINR